MIIRPDKHKVVPYIGYILPKIGGLCQLEGVCAPFGSGVGECAFCNKYIGIGSILPTVCGIYVLVLAILATLKYMQRHE